MSQIMRQNELKLDILQSLARSQRALAHILETLSPDVVITEQTARHLLILIESLSKYQQAIASKLSALSIRQVKNSKPGKPWIAQTLKSNPA
jgi:hypothetical protein